MRTRTKKKDLSSESAAANFGNASVAAAQTRRACAPQTNQANKLQSFDRISHTNLQYSNSILKKKRLVDRNIDDNFIHAHTSNSADLLPAASTF